ncbi:hypothetical protein F183_A44620 [Bryobacterales bacterium F-183]|nr:hypothetical protein F183_A44620 [Bryobacterales bacterium F-183]
MSNRPVKFEVSDPVEVLRQVNLTPRMIEDFRPVTECLEWRLSQTYWREQGSVGFLRNEVPFAITSGGTLSAQAAALLHANCVEARPGADEKIIVLETGAGSGMFARLFLQEFERLCVKAGTDFYSRTVYYVTDGSPETVAQWKRNEQFAGLPVVMGRAIGNDALAVETEQGIVERLTGVRAVFANYVVDSMPGTVVRKGANGPEELHIRTHLIAEPQSVDRLFDKDVDAVRKMAEATDPALSKHLQLMEFESAFLPVSQSYPYLDEAIAFGHDWPRIILNTGAIGYLHGVLDALHADGFVLINDYGMTQAAEAPALGSSQRFGLSTAMVVNFPFLAHHFQGQGFQALAPEHNERLPIHPMLFARRAMGATAAKFQDLFSWDAYSAGAGHQEAARKMLEAGRLDEVGKAYERALQARPADWSLMGEVAEFLLRNAADYEAGRKMAESALALNPWYSAWLWNLLGDALFALNRFAEAHEIYLRAQTMSTNDPRTLLNLGYTYWELGDSEKALEALATGLAVDGSGQYRQRLLEKQSLILEALTRRYAQEQEWLARRAARMTAG